MATQLGPQPIEVVDSLIAISFEQVKKNGQLLDEIQAHFAGRDIPSEGWLNSLGTTSADPCP
jgi:hypothetical protein